MIGKLGLNDLRIVCLFFFLVAPVYGEVITFSAYPNKVIPTANISSEQTVTQPYLCRQHCHDTPSCRGATVTRTTDGGAFLCQVTDDVMDGDLIGSNTYASSYLKNDPTCDAPFTLVEGVGCIAVTVGMGNCNNIQEQCPQNSRLLSLSSLGRFETLRQYLLSDQFDSGSLTEFTWIGLKRDLNNLADKKLYWQDGGYILYEGPHGQYPFSLNDPNLGDDEPCCALFRSQAFKIVDLPSHINSYGVCMK